MTTAATERTDGITAGQHAVISKDGKPWSVGIVKEVRSKSVKIVANRTGVTFSLSTAKEFGGTRTFEIVPRFEAERVKADLQHREERERNERYEADDAKRRAAYDALPEAIKLTNTLKWICDCNSEKKFADAPIEHLRGLVEWAKAKGLETE